MNKWYMNDNIDSGVVLSSRIRLARNVTKYPFSILMNDEQADHMIDEVKSSIINERNPLGAQFNYINLKDVTDNEKHMLMERHVISPELVNKKQVSSVLIKNDESLSIMLNEEDHIRIQSIFVGDNMEHAWGLANKLDDLIEETVQYAFDKDYGYLSSCPTNTGTGLRASYMLHMPMLESTGQLKNILQAITKFGITLRGIYGEGTEPLGSIYQISNQVTLGQSEEEIMNNLKNITNQIIEQELRIAEKILREQKSIIEDKVYRCYGILTYARRMNVSEAMGLLSTLRIGYMNHLIDLPKPKTNIYNIMIHIQQGNMMSKLGNDFTEEAADIKRADFIKEMFLQ